MPDDARESTTHLVVIDDDPVILKLVEAALGREHEVTLFQYPKEAVEALRDPASPPPDLILCDVSMPGMSGFEVHEALRDVVSLRGVPFVYLTAMADRDNYRRGMLLGADDYLTKPFSIAELREAVRVRLTRAGTLRRDAEREMVVGSLGGLGITAGGRRLQWEAKKAAELLLYLCQRGGRSMLREVRRDMWAQSVHDNSLRVLINRLRKTLEGIAEVEVRDETVELHYEGRLRWDAAVFERVASEALETPTPADLEEAISHYRGSFLPGFDSPWADARRAHYEDLYVQLLEKSVEVAPNEASQKRAEARLGAFLES